MLSFNYSSMLLCELSSLSNSHTGPHLPLSAKRSQAQPASAPSHPAPLACRLWWPHTVADLKHINIKLLLLRQVQYFWCLCFQPLCALFILFTCCDDLSLLCVRLKSSVPHCILESTILWKGTPFHNIREQTDLAWKNTHYTSSPRAAPLWWFGFKCTINREQCQGVCIWMNKITALIKGVTKNPIHFTKLKCVYRSWRTTAYGKK